VLADLIVPHLVGQRSPQVVLLLRIYQVKGFVSSSAAGLPTWEVAAAAVGWVIAGLAVLHTVRAPVAGSSFGPATSDGPVSSDGSSAGATQGGLRAELGLFRNRKLWAVYATSMLHIGALFAATSYFAAIFIERTGFAPELVPALLTGFRSENTRYTLAARVTGPVATAFPDGPPNPAATPAKPDEPAKPEQTPAPADFLRQSAQPINIVVVADTDMLDDRFWAQSQDFFGRRVIVPTANNGDFVANAVEVLAGGEDLVDLRSRGSSARHFLLVEQIQRVFEVMNDNLQHQFQVLTKRPERAARTCQPSVPAKFVKSYEYD